MFFLKYAPNDPHGVGGKHQMVSTALEAKLQVASTAFEAF